MYNEHTPHKAKAQHIRHNKKETDQLIYDELKESMFLPVFILKTKIINYNKMFENGKWDVVCVCAPNIYVCIAKVTIVKHTQTNIYRELVDG